MNEDTAGNHSDTARGPRAKRALSRFGVLFWFRSQPERHPRLGHVQVAHLGWRFAEPRDELKPLFEALVREAPRHVEWEFKASKNWLVIPARLTRETRTGGDDFGKAQTELEKDQEFCIAAAKDMDLILTAIEKAAPPPHEPEKSDP